METIELRRIWNTLAKEKLIDKDLAKENILEIITQKSNGVINKLQRKHQLDFNRYLGVVIFMPFVILFLIHRDIQGLLTHGSSVPGGPYVIPCLIEAFMIYALWSIKRNIDFMKRTYNAGTLKESLVKMKSYFETITKKRTGTILLMAILAFIEVDTLIRMGGIENMNFSLNGPYIFESYFSVFIILLTISVPFIVRLDIKRYTDLLRDLDQTLEDLDEKE